MLESTAHSESNVEDFLRQKLSELEERFYREKRGEVYRAVLEEIERPLLEKVLERTDGNQLKAARILGINRNTIRAKIKKLGIIPKAFKNQDLRQK